jgi:hypothetical protein
VLVTSAFKESRKIAYKILFRTSLITNSILRIIAFFANVKNALGWCGQIS